MLWFQLKRILMNVADGSPGAGAPPAAGAPAAAAAAAPITPPAQGGTPAIDQATKDALVKQGRDAAFAELRRSGALKKQFLTNHDADTPATPALDTTQARRLDRALTRSGVVARISDAAYTRIERAFAAEAPDDVDAWVQDYFGGLGSAPPAAATSPTTPPAMATPNQPTAPVAAQPVTARGAPATSQLPLEQMNILKMSDADRKALVATKGLKYFTERLREQLRGVRVQVRRS
ncbi:MAG TPA: hypothetical protein VGG74_11750 [Kofleriaceae bacterium]|jgi:hypothetical protein